MAQRAKYLDIAASVLARIRNLSPGSRCPGVHQITSEYHIARATAERVLRHLAEHGHVQQVAGKGTFVAEPLVRRIAVLPSTAEAAASRQHPQDVAICSELAQQIVRALRQAGHEVHVASVAEEAGAAARTLADVSPELLVTVGIWSHHFLEDLARLGRPIICVEYAPLNLPIDFIATATLRSSYMATRAILEAGLTDVWYIGAEHGWPDASAASLTHSIGFLAACRDAGIANGSTRVRISCGDSDLDAILRRFFSQALRRRAVVAADTSVGSRVLLAARSRGLRVPEDLAIVAASGRGEADVSCLAPNLAGLASAAAELVQRRIRQPDLPAQVARICPEFVDAGTLPAAATEWLRSMLVRP